MGKGCRRFGGVLAIPVVYFLFFFLSNQVVDGEMVSPFWRYHRHLDCMFLCPTDPSMEEMMSPLRRYHRHLDWIFLFIFF